MFKFDASILGSEAPVDRVGVVVAMSFPRRNFASHLVDFGDATVKALAFEGTEFDFSDVEPTAMLGRVMDFKTLSQSPGLWRWEGVVKRADGMDIEIVHDQPDFNGIGITLLQHVPNKEGPIGGLAVLGDDNVPPPTQRFDFQKDFGHAVTNIFVVNEGRMARSRRDGGGDFANELLGGFIHAHQRKPAIVRQVVEIENILHGGHKGSVLMGRDLPILAQVRLKFVFFSTR